jgi:hypothetical protein
MTAPRSASSILDLKEQANQLLEVMKETDSNAYATVNAGYNHLVGNNTRTGYCVAVGIETLTCFHKNIGDAGARILAIGIQFSTKIETLQLGIHDHSFCRTMQNRACRSRCTSDCDRDQSEPHGAVLRYKRESIYLRCCCSLQ